MGVPFGMRARRILPLVALLAVVAAGCNYPTIDPPGAAPVRYRDPVFSNVTVTNDITYGTATNLSNQPVTLKLDMYAPTGDTVTERPAIVWVHGGSFCCGDRTSGELVDEATTFAKAGFVNVSIEYRLESPGCTGNQSNCVLAIQEAAADAQTAVRFLRTNAATYGIDTDRIAIGGSSAGAITALNVAYTSSEDPTARVRAAQSISGAHLGVGATSVGRRAGARLPLHDRPAGELRVGDGDDRLGPLVRTRRVPRVLERDLPRALRRAPPADPRPHAQLLLVGDGPGARRDLSTGAAVRGAASA